MIKNSSSFMGIEDGVSEGRQTCFGKCSPSPAWIVFTVTPILLETNSDEEGRRGKRKQRRKQTEIIQI
jgi:hypothetical protein